MKRIFNLKALLLVLLTAMAWSANAQVKINDTNFPDANFRSWLLAQDYGKDGVLTESEINSVTKIDIVEKNISTLTGIEVFKALKYLYCSDNQLTRLNVSENKALEYLNCDDNQLTYLNVSGNTALKELWCKNNQLTTLDVSKNTALTMLQCYLNQLTTLDVSKLTALNNLGCQKNQLTTLDVSKNTALIRLKCHYNQLSTLDVSKNTALTSLVCSDNQLTTLDVSKNTALKTLWCDNNKIKGSNMDALISSLAVNTTNDSHDICVIDKSGDTERNICTKSQVAAIKAKGWTVQAWDGKEYVDYEGSEDVEPLPDPDELTDISQYSNIVYVEPTSALIESTVTIPVKMKNSKDNIMGFQFDLRLPDGVTLAKDEDGFYMVELSTDRTTARKHVVSSELQASGMVRVICYSNNNSTFSGTDGNVLMLTLQVAADAAADDYALILHDLVMTTPSMDSYTVADVVCRFTVEDYIPGDVTGDRLVNVVDVAGAVNLILNSGDTSKLNRKAADIDGNKTINVVDVAGIVSIILGNTAQNSRAMKRAQAPGQPRLFIDDFQMNPGETKTVSVNLSNPGDVFTGCQFDLYLPKGLSVAEEDGYALIDIGSRSSARKHTASASVQADGSLRVVCYSNTNSTFSGDEGDILSITLQADASATEGNAILAMRNITLSRPDVSGISVDDQEVSVTIGSQSQDQGIAINATNFPDDNFRNYLLSQSYGSDGMLTGSEIKNVTRIDVSSTSIKSLKGIEYFTALTSLYCEFNQLTALDVSKNTALEELSCYNNQLTALDVSKNTALTHLDCCGNQLIALDVSKNTALEELSCYNNQLTALDVSKNTALEWLWCDGNQLTALDVSKNTALTNLFCGDNQLTALDVSKNTALTNLFCGDNQLTALDVSKNTALTNLSCYGNSIKGTDMDALIGSLPQRTGDYSCIFRVVDISENTNEGNVCTKAQVAAAKAKRWRVLALVGDKYVDYEGSDDLSGISDAVWSSAETAPVFTLSGQRLAAPRKGINIVGGKKIMVK